MEKDKENMYLILLISLFISILLEATVVALPLAFILLLCYSILNRSSKVFLSAFATGIVLDIFKARVVGQTSMYFLVIFVLLLLYQRKYEIRSYMFVVLSSFIGSYIYLLLIAQSASFSRSAICSILATIIFAIGKKLRKREE